MNRPCASAPGQISSPSKALRRTVLAVQFESALEVKETEPRKTVKRHSRGFSKLFYHCHKITLKFIYLKDLRRIAGKKHELKP